MRIGIDKAKENISTLVEFAELGRIVEIEDRNGSMVRLIPIESPVAAHDHLEGCPI